MGDRERKDGLPEPDRHDVSPGLVPEGAAEQPVGPELPAGSPSWWASVSTEEAVREHPPHDL